MNLSEINEALPYEVREFVLLVSNMRDKQKEYFDVKLRKPTTLKESKALEVLVDKRLQEFKKKQK